MDNKPEQSKQDFEIALAELEEIAKRMERGDQTLEQSLQDFERGIQLSRVCQDKLKSAEQRVRMLKRQGDSHAEVPLSTESAD